MILITYNGQTHTIEEWADITGLKADTIYWRFRRGYHPKFILNPTMYRNKSKTAEINGECYTLPELEKMYGVNRRTLAARIARGVRNPDDLLRPVSHSDYFNRKKREEEMYG